MVPVILAGLVGLWGLWGAGVASATTYYVATTGSDANTCSAAQSSSTPKLTIQAGVNCLAGGDTLTVKAGNYGDQSVVEPPTGTPSAYTVIQGDPSGARPILTPSYANVKMGLNCQRGSGCSYIEFRHFEVRDAKYDVKLWGSPTTGYPHHINVIDNYFWGGGISIQIVSSATTYEGGDHLIKDNLFEQKGRLMPGYAPGTNTIYNTGNRTIVEGNTFRRVYAGIVIYGNDTSADRPPINVRDVIIRNNIFYDNARPSLDAWQVGQGGAQGIAISRPGGGHQIYNNIFYRSGEESSYAAVYILPYGGSITTPINIYNNTFYNFLSGTARAVWVNTTKCTAGCFITNNLAYQTGGFVSGTQTNNLTSNPSFTDAANANFTLTSGSAAIDAGSTSTGAAYCGTAPDVGAYETLGVTGASIYGNTLDITTCTAKPPVVPGTFTVACTGCGTPTVSSAVTVGGGLVRLTIDGITGGACAALQTWTVSTAGTGTTDSAIIGSTQDPAPNQALHTVTNYSVNSSACDGTGGSSPPVGPIAIYEFTSNLNDSSGNANHAVGSAGISYVAAKDGTGVRFTAGTDSYVDTGLLNGHNPSTNHLVVSFWIRVPVGELGKTRTVAGTALGTNQRFYITRDVSNAWYFVVQNSPGNLTEFPVVEGDQHICLKFNPTTDVATMSVNGVAGTITDASQQSYTSYTFASTFRFGLPSGFFTSVSGSDIIDRGRIYTSDVSCADIYNAENPTTASSTAVQAGHRWQGVYLDYTGAVENRGAVNAQRKIRQGGAAALVTQLSCNAGSCGTFLPRLRYNINGGAFNFVVPDTATADGVAYLGQTVTSGMNAELTTGALTGSLTHTNGGTLLNSTAIPTVVMATDTSYTFRHLLRITAAPGTVVCFKLYDQGGQPMASYTPSAGACLTVITPRAGF